MRLNMIATKEAAVSAIQLLLYEYNNLENVSKIINISKSNISRYLSGQILPSVEVTENALAIVKKQRLLEKWAKDLIQIRSIGENRVVDPSMILAYPRLLHLLIYDLLSRFSSLKKVDLVVSAEVEGLSFALTAARILEIPLVYARRKKPLMGDFEQVEIVKPSSGIIENLYLPRVLLERKKNALFVDDVIRTGATANALKTVLNQNKITMDYGVVLVKFPRVKVKMELETLMTIT